MAAAVAVIGCAGNGSSGGSVTSGGGTGTDGRLQVSIPTPPGFTVPPGQLDFGFLSGQGRAVGDLTLVISRIEVSDEFGVVTNPLPPYKYVALSRYTFQTQSLTVPFNQGQDSRLFENYLFDPLYVEVETTGAPNRIETFGTRNPDGSFSLSWPPAPIPISARVFPGRSTMVPIFLDDSMFEVEQTAGGQSVVVFDEARFRVVNDISGSERIQGFINDYVSFDISGMAEADRPSLVSEPGKAARLYVSGDAYAISSAAASGAFEILTERVDDPIVGTFRVPSTLPGATTPGTFTLQQLDPTDLQNVKKIVSLQGIWRPHTSVLSGFGTWNLVTFPNSNDGPQQEAVLFKSDGSGRVTNLLYGFLDFDLKTINLFPVKTIVDGIVDEATEVKLTITGQFDRNGSATVAPRLTRSGNFTVTANGGLADLTGGTFIVFRV